MYDNKRSAPLTVRAYIAELAVEGSTLSFDEVKSQMDFYFDFEQMRNSTGIECEFEAEEAFQKKMQSFSYDSLVSDIVSYKGEGEGCELYFSDDLEHLSDYRGKYK